MGCWCDGTREMAIDGAGLKRLAPRGCPQRANELLDTGKNHGPKTFFGQLADQIAGQRELTSFDKGANRFTWLMIRFMLLMASAVFLINGVTKGNWLEALLFAVAIAVGLTPEMLPMIVTVNLAKGAIDMARRRVIVKRLQAIQNFGAMDVLCTDKTGTLIASFK
jgi:P-type Mg2+ transporter